MLESLFNLGLKTYNFTKKRLQHRSFPVKIAKFFRTAFLVKHFRWLLLNWLVITFDSLKITLKIVKNIHWFKLPLLTIVPLRTSDFTRFSVKQRDTSSNPLLNTRWHLPTFSVVVVSPGIILFPTESTKCTEHFMQSKKQHISREKALILISTDFFYHSPVQFLSVLIIFWCLYCLLRTHLTPCSSVSIVKPERVNAGWVIFRFTTNVVGQKRNQNPVKHLRWTILCK